MRKKNKKSHAMLAFDKMTKIQEIKLLTFVIKMVLLLNYIRNVLIFWKMEY